MKRLLLVSLMVVLVFSVTSVYAAERYALGNSHMALKVDYINFTEDVFDKIDLNNGVYLGLEGYYAIAPNLYLGLEAGWAGSENDGNVNVLGENIDVDTNVNYVPIELNLKYAIPLSPQWVASLGAGISYNWFEVELETNGDNHDASDWVFGGQVFADITYKFSNQWFVGINGKYQFTEKLSFDRVDTDTKADNWRTGVHVGLMF